MEPQCTVHCRFVSPFSLQLKAVYLSSTHILYFKSLSTTETDEDTGVAVGGDENTEHYHHAGHCKENASTHYICCGYGQAEYPEENHNYFNPSASYNQTIPQF